MNIQTIIFSRDRAMQLDAVLRSFFIHCQDSDKTRVVVLFLATDDVHARQYETLRSAYPDVNFFAQRHFRHDVWSFVLRLASGAIKCRFWWLDSINTAGLFLERLPGKVIRRTSKQWRQRILRRLAPGSPDKTHFLFLVDDNIFVRDFHLTPIARSLEAHPNALGFSLRLGTNTTYTYAKNRPIILPTFTAESDGVLEFDWTAADGEFAYPLEISSSLYRAADITPLIVSLPFTNPNELEYQMAIRTNEYCVTMPGLLCAPQSLTFCNPVNIVQNFAPNRAGANAAYSSEHLAKLFNQRYRIDVDAYSGFVPKGCHQEVELKFNRV